MAAHSLVTCKNEEVQYENKGARVTNTLNIDFSDASYSLNKVCFSQTCYIHGVKSKHHLYFC